MARDRNEKRRRRRGGIVDILNAILTLVIIGMVVAVGGLLYAANQFYADGVVATDTAFTVERGSSISTVAARLEEQGLIPSGQLLPSTLLFRLGATALKKESGLKAGVYTLKANSSMADIITELTEGKPVEFFVNVIPGETSYQVAQRLNDPALSLTGDPVELPPEGSLLAVRYDFFPGDTRQAVLDAMTARMKAAVDEIWAGRDPSIDEVIKSPAELVTLASIVEKETGVAGERPQVAAVFINRLKRGMRLQTDPTVIYGITKGEGVLGRGLRQSELRRETPWNTYVIDGLPPTPIANPGADAIKAAMNPDQTDFLFFVADGTGGHVFAETLEEHNENVAKWRAIEDEQGTEGETGVQGD